MRRLLVILGLAAASGLAAAVTGGCGEPFAAIEASGGTGGRAGAHTAVTTTGSASATTSTSTGSSTGGGGSEPVACKVGMGLDASSCAQDEYCDTSTTPGKCVACASLDRLHFASPVQLTLSQPMGVTEMFPRVNADTGDLFLVIQTMTPVYHTQIATAASSKPGGWMPPTLFAPLVGTNQDNAPLYLHDAKALAGLVDPSVASSGEPVLLFDSDRIAGKRKVFALLLGTMSVAIPVALSLPGGAAHESDIAVASAVSPPRFFWLSDAGTEPQRLVTAVATDGSPTDVAVTLDNGCASPLASTPWVTPGGEWLLFASTRPDAANGCAAPPADAPTQIFATRLDASGSQMGAAVPIANATGSTLDNAPALWMPSQCAMLFTRFDVSNGMGSLYAAARD